MSKLVCLTGARGYLGAWVEVMLMKAGHCVCYSPGEGPLGVPDAVVHLHWYSSAGNGQEEIQKYCLERTKSLVLDTKPSTKLIFASTASVYPIYTGQHLAVEYDPIDPQCHYTRAKAATENFIKGWHSNYLIIRYGSLMGRGITRTKTDVCVNAFATDGWLNKKIQCWHPYAWKPVLHVQDAAQLIIDAIEHDWKGTLNAAVESRRAIDLANRIGRITQAEVEVVEKEGEQRSVRLDIARWLMLREKADMLGDLKTVDDAVKELQGYVPMEGDRNRPWQLDASGNRLR